MMQGSRFRTTGTVLDGAIGSVAPFGAEYTA